MQAPWGKWDLLNGESRFTSYELTLKLSSELKRLCEFRVKSYELTFWNGELTLNLRVKFWNYELPWIHKLDFEITVPSLSI